MIKFSYVWAPTASQILSTLKFRSGQVRCICPIYSRSFNPRGPSFERDSKEALITYRQKIQSYITCHPSGRPKYCGTDAHNPNWTAGKPPAFCGSWSPDSLFRSAMYLSKLFDFRFVRIHPHSIPNPTEWPIFPPQFLYQQFHGMITKFDRAPDLTFGC